jgi:hypothetical protein
MEISYVNQKKITFTTHSSTTTSASIFEGATIMRYPWVSPSFKTTHPSEQVEFTGSTWKAFLRWVKL